MAFIMIRIEAPNLSVVELNQKVKLSANQREGVVQIRDLVEGALAGAISAEIDVAVRDTTQSITAAGGGSSAQYNLK